MFCLISLSDNQIVYDSNWKMNKQSEKEYGQNYSVYDNADFSVLKLSIISEIQLTRKMLKKCLKQIFMRRNN